MMHQFLCSHPGNLVKPFVAVEFRHLLLKPVTSRKTVIRIFHIRNYHLQISIYLHICPHIKDSQVSYLYNCTALIIFNQLITK